MNCPNCHSENRDGAKYCNECGFPLSGRIAEVASADAEDALVAALASEQSAATSFAVPTAEEPQQEERSSKPQRPLPESSSAWQQESESDLAADVTVDAYDDDPSTSGPLDPARVPSIDVAGVTVDDDGNPFDFGPLDVEDASAFDPAYPEEEPFDEFPEETEDEFDFGSIDEMVEVTPENDADLTARVPRVGLDAAATADLSGIERLVDPNYVPPAAAWRAGDTMEMPAVDGGASGARKDFRAPDPNKKRDRKREKEERKLYKEQRNEERARDKQPHPRRRAIIAAIVALLVVAGGAAAATYQMEWWGGHVIPDVVGSSQADATAELESKGFVVVPKAVKSDDVEGKVLLTDPAAGSRIEEGAEIVLSVSTARVVPAVVGLPRDEAAALMDDEGFENVEYQTVKSDSPKGSVLAVEPAAGEKAKAAAHIVVQVATPYTVPDVAGKSQADAEAALAEAGFTSTIKQVYTEDITEGVAVSTDPAAGTEVASGTAITLNVAKSRANELVSTTHTYFQSSKLFTVDGVTYEVNPDTLDVSYKGNDTTSYAITARVVETHDYLFFGSQTLYGDWKTITGTITWSDSDEVASSSPSIARA